MFATTVGDYYIFRKLNITGKELCIYLAFLGEKFYLFPFDVGSSLYKKKKKMPANIKSLIQERITGG